MTSWLITGGTGSFGHAFARYLLTQPDTERVAILSRDELKQATMRQAIDDPRMRYFIGTVDDEDRVALACEGVDHVVHAAAMKRIEVCEDNPMEAVHTNLTGTIAVAKACRRAGVAKAVFLSTDKAAAPFTHYGTTKLAAERVWCRMNVYAAGTGTRFAATRYGNVVGSRGSVVPIFREQARLGGPITIRDPRMTRFWMTIDQACELVALAFREMQGGEVFVPKLPCSSVLQLAEAIAPGVPTVVTGMAEGEKLHETLITEDEARLTYDHGDHYRIETTRTWEGSMHADVQARRVPEGFTYRSDAPALDGRALGALVA